MSNKTLDKIVSNAEKRERERIIKLLSENTVWEDLDWNWDYINTHGWETCKSKDDLNHPHDCSCIGIAFAIRLIKGENK